MMQIDGTHGVDPLHIPGGAKSLVRPDQPAAGTDRPAEAPGPRDPDVEPYIRRAAEAPEVRPDAVAEAKRLLASGSLDTPEAAGKAAERLLRDGI
jgi:hypothetical protein